MRDQRQKKGSGHRRAQSSFEFTTLIIIILGAMLTMQIYMKRGIQGRWKSATDDIGEQYDMNAMNGEITYHLSGTTITKVTTVPAEASGYWSLRSDQSNMVETKSGRLRIMTEP